GSPTGNGPCLPGSPPGSPTARSPVNCTCPTEPSRSTSGGYWPSFTSATASRPSCRPTHPAASSPAARDPPSPAPPCPLPCPGAPAAVEAGTGGACGVGGWPGCGRLADAAPGGRCLALVMPG